VTGRVAQLGKTERLAEGLWFIHGEMPQHASKAPDFCNVVIYRTGHRLYMVDSGWGCGHAREYPSGASRSRPG
jgi:hypothetical protein